MSITLFDLARQIRESAYEVDEETGEIFDTFSGNRELFENKAIACVAYAKEEATTLAAAKEMIKEMGEKIKAREARLDSFHGYIADCMKATGITEVKHELGIFGAKLYLERDESVVIEEGARFDPELCNDPKPPEPSKTRIKNAIKNGQAIAGAHLVRNDRLVIS